MGVLAVTPNLARTALSQEKLSGLRFDSDEDALNFARKCTKDLRSWFGLKDGQAMKGDIEPKAHEDGKVA